MTNRFRLVMVALVAVLVAARAVHQPAAGLAGDDVLQARCGVERWPVKVLADPDAALVNLMPVETTVAELAAIPAPRSLPSRGRVGPVENTTYVLTALVVEAKREEDSDIHLVIADPSDPSITMIVEFPDAQNCALTTDPLFVEWMTAARQAFVDAFGTPPRDHFAQLSGMAQLNGVGFFDFRHGQRGIAPNGIELHPVLGFSIVEGE